VNSCPTEGTEMEQPTWYQPIAQEKYNKL